MKKTINSSEEGQSFLEQVHISMNCLGFCFFALDFYSFLTSLLLYFSFLLKKKEKFGKSKTHTEISSSELLHLNIFLPLLIS